MKKKKKTGDSTEVAWSKDPKSEDQIAFDWEEGGSFAEKMRSKLKKTIFPSGKEEK